MNLVGDKLTLMTAGDVLRAIRAALPEASNSAVAIFCAQSALETGRWRSMHCFNFGNMRPPAGWNGDYCQFRCNEQVKPGVWKWYDPPDPGSNFLAFDAAEAGIAYWLQRLKERWPEAYDGAMQGMPAQFVHGLKARNYFTADEAPYLKGVLGLTHEFLAVLEQMAEPEPVPEHEPDWQAIVPILSIDLSTPAKNLDEHDTEPSPPPSR